MKWLALLLALITPAQADVYAPPPAVVSTNAIQACPLVTGTLTNVGDAVTSACPSAASFLVWMTANGATALNGTIAATDPGSGGSRLLFKTGQFELDVSTVTMTGNPTGLIEYRAAGGGNGLRMALTAASAGSATVNILPSNQAILFLPNAPFHTADEGAVRAGRGYTISTSYQPLSANQYLSLYVSNPATNGVRLILKNRLLACDATTALRYFGLGSVTTNIPTTAVTVPNRKTGGSVSNVTAFYGVGSTRPDTATSTTAPPGGIVPALGGEPTLPERTLEPGTNYSMFIQAPGTLGTNVGCTITFVTDEESIN